MKPFSPDVRTLEGRLINTALADRSVVKRLSRIPLDDYFSSEARSLADSLLKNRPVTGGMQDSSGKELPTLASTEVSGAITQVRELAVLRRAVQYGTELSKIAERGDVENTGKLLDRPPLRRPLSDGVTIGTAMTAYLSMAATVRSFTQMPKPFEDVILSGGSVCVVAGGPGSGKSALVEQIAWDLSTRGEKVLDLSVELSGVDRAARYAQHLQGASAGLRAVVGKTVDHVALGNAARAAIANPNLIVNAEAKTLHEVKAAIRHSVEQDGVRVVIIDFLQRIMIPGVSDIYERVTRVADELWALGNELGIAQIWCAQLNRAGRKGETRPTMADIEGSGLVEQLAWDVLIVHNPDPLSPSPEQPVTIYRDKARYGPKGVRSATYKGSSYTFDFSVGKPLPAVI